MKQLHGISRLLGIIAAAGLLAAACSPTPAAPTVAPTPLPPTVAPTEVPPTAAPTALPPTAVPTAVPATETTTPESTATSEPVPVKFDIPSDIAFDADGNLYLSQTGPDVPLLVRIDPAGQQTAVVANAEFPTAFGLAFDGEGNLYIADYWGNRVRRIDQAGAISTVAGNGDHGIRGGFAGDGGPATEALLGNPTDVAFDAEGNLYIVEEANQRIRKVDPQGIITTFAGTGETGFAGDGGPAIDAQFHFASIGIGSGTTRASVSLAFDAEGNLYVADGANSRVRKIDREGIITTIAGTGEEGFSGDGGPAIEAQLSQPAGLAFDAGGNLYVSDNPGITLYENRVRKIDTDGIITTVVGAGLPDFGGDGGPATAALVKIPWGMAFDSAGNLYLADAGNNRVRKVDPDGIITTLVGGGF